MRVINEVGHAWGVRMGTRLQYDLCSHVYSHYPSTAKGSLLPPLWLKYHCRSPEKTIANAEAVHLLLSLWLRTDHSCINKEHIHIGENLRFTIYIHIHTYTYIHIHTYTYIYIHIPAQFRARADEVRGESLQFKRGELIKFRKRGGQKLLSKHVQRVKKTFRAPESFLFPSE